MFPLRLMPKKEGLIAYSAPALIKTIKKAIMSNPAV